MKKLCLIAIALAMAGLAMAQNQSDCGTPPLDTAEFNALPRIQNPNYLGAFVDSVEQVYAEDRLKSLDNQVYIRIPIAFWVYYNDDYANIDDTEVKNVMQDINERFQGTPIRFYLDCDINYVYNDNLIRSSTSLALLAASNNKSGVVNIHVLREVANAAGVYISTAKGVIGISNDRPGGTRASKRSTYAHELGHFLGLLHTHHIPGFNGSITSFLNTCSKEPIDRSSQFSTINFCYKSGTKCFRTGDGFCDTPADPELNRNNISTATCTFNDPTAQDHEDNFYMFPPDGSSPPDARNIMSYAPDDGVFGDHCRTRFSNGQTDKMIEKASKRGWTQTDFNIFDEYEPNNNSQMATELLLGKENEQIHSFHAWAQSRNFVYCYDADFFEINIVDPRIYRFYTKAVSNKAIPETFLQLLDANGNLVADSDNGYSGDNISFMQLPLDPGTYFLKVTNRALETSDEKYGVYQIGAGQCEDCCYQPDLSQVTTLNSTTGSYNMGTRQVQSIDFIPNNLTVDGVTLGVSLSQGLGFSTNPGSFPAFGSELDLRFCDNKVLTVINAGVLNIGSFRGNGNIFVDNTPIHINDNSSFLLNSQSTATVKNNGFFNVNDAHAVLNSRSGMFIENNGTVYLDNATLTLNNESEMVFGNESTLNVSNSDITLNGSSARMEFQLGSSFNILEGEAVFSINQGSVIEINGFFNVNNVGSNKRLEVSGGGTLILNPQNDVDLTETEIVVLDDSRLIIGEDANMLYALDKAVTLAGSNSILEIAGRVDLQGGSVFGISNSTDPDHGYVRLVRPLSLDNGPGDLNNFFYCTDASSPARIEMIGSGHKLMEIEGQLNISSGFGSPSNFISEISFSNGNIHLIQATQPLIYAPSVKLSDVSVLGAPSGNNGEEALKIGIAPYQIGGIANSCQIDNCVFSEMVIRKEDAPGGNGAEVKVTNSQFRDNAIARLNTYNSTFTSGSFAIIENGVISGCDFSGNSNISYGISARGTSILQGNSIVGYNTGVRVEFDSNVGLGCNNISNNERGIYIGGLATANMASHGLRDNIIVNNTVSNIHHEYSRMVNTVLGGNTLFNDQLTEDGRNGPQGGLILSGHFVGNCNIDAGRVYNLTQNQWSSQFPDFGAPQTPSLVDQRKFTLKMGSYIRCSTCDVTLTDSSPRRDNADCEPNQPIGKPVVTIDDGLIDPNELIPGSGTSYTDGEVGNSTECVACPEITFSTGSRYKLPDAISYAAEFSTISNGSNDVVALNLFLEIFENTALEWQLLDLDVTVDPRDFPEVYSYMQTAYFMASAISNVLISEGNLGAVEPMLQIFNKYRVEQFGDALEVEVYSKVLDEVVFLNSVGSYESAANLANELIADLSNTEYDVLLDVAEPIQKMTQANVAFVNGQISESEFGDEVNALIGNGPGGVYTTPDGGWDPCGNGGQNFSSSESDQLNAQLIGRESREATKSENKGASNTNIVTEQGLIIFPNPASEELNILVPQSEISNVVLVNSIGKVVISKIGDKTSKVKLNISGLSQGLYMVKVLVDGEPVRMGRVILK